MAKRIPTALELRNLICLDPSTGLMTWRTRPNKKSFNSRHAGKPALTALNMYGYYCGKVKSCDVLAHRVAWAIHYGQWPKGHIDHINGNRSDNRIENLRSVSAQENQKNRRISVNNTSGHCGVRWRSGRWIAEIRHKGVKIHISSRRCLTAAAIDRKLKEIELGFHENHGASKV